MTPVSIALSLVAIKVVAGSDLQVEARSTTAHPVLEKILKKLEPSPRVAGPGLLIDVSSTSGTTTPGPEFLCWEKCPGFPGGETDECAAKCLKMSVEEFKAQKLAPPELPEEFLCWQKCPGFPGGETEECGAKCLKISVEEFKALSLPPPVFPEEPLCLEKCPGFPEEVTEECASKCEEISVTTSRAPPVLTDPVICLEKCPGFSEKAETPDCGSKCLGMSVEEYKAMPPLFSKQIHASICLEKCPTLSDGSVPAECGAKCLEVSVEDFESRPKFTSPKPSSVKDGDSDVPSRSSSGYVKKAYSALVKANVFQGDYEESRPESPDSMHSASHKLFAPLSILTILPFA